MSTQVGGRDRSGGARGLARLPPQLPVAVALGLPGLWLGAAEYLGWPHPELPPPVAAAVFGVAIIGAAFLLSWAGEAAQVDLSAGLALALLAVLAVLPEYAVDFVFTVKAGGLFAQTGACLPGPDGSTPCSLALANMTGANRVLVGVGWPLVVLVAAVAVTRRRRADTGTSDSGADTANGAAAPDDDTTSDDSDPASEVGLRRSMSAEVVFLGLVTLYSLHLPLRASLTILDGAVLVTLFAAYLVRLGQAPAEDPELTGVSEFVGRLATVPRRAGVAAMFGVAAAVILATAEHFAETLVATGTQLGADTFVLVQWVAPLASEAPELIVAGLYAWRLKAGDALGALLSSKVNQWSLLVGTLPVVFAVRAATWHGLPLDDHQRVELFVTGAQSVFAVSLLAGLRLSGGGALLLFVLFAGQFLASVSLPRPAEQPVTVSLGGLYLLLAGVVLVRRRREVGRLVRDGLSTPYREL